MRRILAFLLLGALVFLCACAPETADPGLVFSNTRGTWQLSGENTLTQISESCAAVALNGEIYSLAADSQGWRLTAEGPEGSRVLYEASLEYGDDAAGRPRWSPWVIARGLQTAGEYLAFLALDTEAECTWLCTFSLEETSLAVWEEFSLPALSLLSDGAYIYGVMQGETGQNLPFRFDVETGSFTCLSQTPNNVNGQIWLEDGRLWWVSLAESGEASLCAVPTSGGETETWSVEHVSYVGGGQVFYSQGDALWTADIASGDCRQQPVPEGWQGEVAAASRAGAVLISGDEYWLLDFQEGSLTPLEIEENSAAEGGAAASAPAAADGEIHMTNADDSTLALDIHNRLIMTSEAAEVRGIPNLDAPVNRTLCYQMVTVDAVVYAGEETWALVEFFTFDAAVDNIGWVLLADLMEYTAENQRLLRYPVRLTEDCVDLDTGEPVAWDAVAVEYVDDYAVVSWEGGNTHRVAPECILYPDPA